MIRRLFNTLQYRLDAEEKEWRSLNRVRGELKPGFLHRWILRVASNPALFGGQLFVVVSIFALVTALVDSKHWVVLYVANFEKPDPVAYGGNIEIAYEMQESHRAPDG